MNAVAAARIHVVPLADGDINLALTAQAMLATLRRVPLGTALGAHGGPGMLAAAFQHYEAPAEAHSR